jgi:hypothetical protein
MTPVVPVWAEEEVEIENESQAEEITEDGFKFGISSSRSIFIVARG